MKIHIKLLLVFGCAFSAFCLTACYSGADAAPPSVIDVARVSERVGELMVVHGGAISRRLERDSRFEPINLIIIAGANAPLIEANGRMIRKIVVGADSAEGVAIIRILEEEKPWNWSGFEVEPFANALTMSGALRGRQWKYISAYPDPNVADLLAKIRKAVITR